VNETHVLAALDELIERTAPNDCSALVVALSARLCGLGALSLNAATKRQPQTTAEEPERNPSAKEAAPEVVQQGCPGAQVEAKSASQGDEVDFHWINLKARSPPVWR